MGRKQLIHQARKALQELGGEATTGAILEVIDRNYRWGTTITSLSNVLARYPDFIKVQEVDWYVKRDQFGPGYRVRQTIWRLDQ